MRLLLLPALILLTLASLASLASAGEGRLEISQTCAVETGCGPNDAPGFPVILQATGSYVLTSDLVPGPGLSAIEIRQNSIDLDLNGFSLRGPGILGSPASGIISFNLFAFNSRIHDGAVRGFRGKGIDLGQIDGIGIEDLLVYDNDEGGIALGDHGLVTETRVRNNGAFGMSLGSQTAYEDCVVTGTQGGPAVIGGRQIGGSHCDDNTCNSHPPLRRYYVSNTVNGGTNAAAACASGFHVASVWELVNPGALQYDNSFGLQGDGSGPGLASGWAYVRSGMTCSDWTDSAGMGTIIFPSSSPTGQEIGIWGVQEASCATGVFTRVWCITD